MYSWEELLDLKFVKRNIRIIHRPDFLYEHLLLHLNISKDQAFNLTADKRRYTQRYYDSRDSTLALDIFHERVNLEDLLNRTEKLLHFGSLFSSKRVVKQLQSSKKFWDSLLHEMVPNNPIILEVVEKITSRIGKARANGYIGIHARLGDHFSKKSEATIQGIIDRLKTDFSDPKSNPNNNTNTENVIDPDFNKACYPKFNSKSPIIIYLATDSHRNDTSLRPFLETFPCVYMLDDFQIEPAKDIVNPLDGTNMFKYLVSLVDLLVASRGSKFYGTPSSTFSGYAQRLNTFFHE
ncbi:10488_t:CDS:1 [Acaulospora colombiana]|uniref:10488_t:CDS:1 n=1 Tax=Acaulospora colombiana TaxID=27376 RepID=A0ACA9NCC3_9GLOM|nr:10488_t:CDS:1 [Acaulospora colombiana]